MERLSAQSYAYILLLIVVCRIKEQPYQEHSEQGEVVTGTGDVVLTRGPVSGAALLTEI